MNARDNFSSCEPRGPPACARQCIFFVKFQVFDYLNEQCKIWQIDLTRASNG